MKTSFFLRISIALLLTTGLAWSAAAEEQQDEVDRQLTEARFRQLLKQLRPDSDEPWRTIPWKIGLLDAQRSAAEADKPIFIWAMDGHPLGCT